MINDVPWFVAKDVATILGYKDTDQSIRKHVAMMDKLTRRFDGSGQNRDMTLINESGLYSLVFKSHMPKAEEFTHWVTSDVLPSIRKYGMYAKDELLANPDLFIEVLQQLKAEREKLQMIETENKQLSAIVEQQTPKVEYYDEILRSPNAIPITVIAQDYDLTCKQMNQILKDLGVQYNCGGTWVLKAKYNGRGFTDSETNSVNNGAYVHTKWTQKGRLFLYDILKKNGYLPVIERTDDNNDTI